MKKIRLTLLFILMVCCLNISAAFQNETLHYVVSYKWGLVHKDAGDATLTLRNQGSDYVMILTAKTKPWADRIFSVRDTLSARMSISGMKPKWYTKTTHEGGKYGQDKITYSYSGNSVSGAVTRYKDKKGKISRTNKTLTAQGRTFDMLSIFYYLRSLDFDKMKKGHIYKMNIFSGSKVELMTVKNVGLETIKLRNKTKREAYHLRFNFTTKGKKKSSDDMDVWISNDSRHIPLQLQGSLPIGMVKCYYTGG